ncbi:MAG: aminopeptidase P family protein [Crenarchaeota archaeon]|nr:aminopeptidase P family protein [Thermoproteota archaeon]
MIKEKLQKIVHTIESKDLDAIILSEVPNVEYLLEIYVETPTVMIRVNRDSTYVIYVSKLDRDRIVDMLGLDESCVKTFSAIPGPDEISVKDVYRFLVKDCKKIGVDSVELLEKLSKKVGNEISISGVKEDIERIRSVKSEREIELIERSIKIAEKCLEETMHKVKPGAREIDVEALLTKIAIEHECALAFKPIVASGPNSAYPHHVSSTRRISRGDVVVIDFGTRYRCYCSDITRTIVVGSTDGQVRDVMQAVAEAHRKAVSIVRKGIKTSEADLAAREVLREYGIDRYFIHSLGHGLGVECHERPGISPVSEEIFESGNVITIEPGAYMRGMFGIRIEDDYLVTDAGARRLCSFPQLLI